MQMQQQEGGDKNVELFSAESRKKNEKAVEFCHTSMSVVSGSIAGIMGLTGLTGFAFLIAMYFITAIAIWVVKLQMDVPQYFHESTASFLFGRVFTQAASFVLFWTLAYGLVHIY